MRQILTAVAVAIIFTASTGCAGLLGVGGASVTVKEYEWSEFHDGGQPKSKKRGCGATYNADSKLFSSEALTKLASGCLDDNEAGTPNG